MKGDDYEYRRWSGLASNLANSGLSKRTALAYAFLGSCLLLMAVAGIIIFFVFLTIHKTDFGNPSFRTIAIFSASIFSATIIIFGWLVNHQLIASRNQKQHTFEAISATRLSETFQKHVLERRKLTNKYPNLAEVIDEVHLFVSYRSDDMKSTDLAAGLDSLVYLLNYYEFLAATVKSGAFNEEFLNDMVGGIATSLVEYAEPLIRAYQLGVPNSQGELEGATPKAFENLVQLSNRWST